MKQKTSISPYRASDAKALQYLIAPLLLLLLGAYLSFSSALWPYLVGQLLLSVFFAQCFILLHECGHLNFFKTRFLNQLMGNVFGFLTMIPFYTWQHMHHLHHKWTGWRDKDPTTEKTVEPSKSPVMRHVANFSWRFFIPIFYMVYKISNYWDLKKIKRFVNATRYRRSVQAVVTYLIIYVLLAVFFGHFMVSYVLPAFLVSLIWKELIILTQHSHVEIPISNGAEVRPVAYKDQIPFTRSFYTSRWVEEYLLFNFNYHEAHHVYPGLPAYWLSKVDIGTPRSPYYCEWFKQAKAMKGEDYIFRTSKHTGRKF